MPSQLQVFTPQQAWDFLQEQAKAIFVDVRSNMEYLFIGHPIGAINIPWIDEPDWIINPNFVREIRKLALGGLSHDEGGTDVPVILICRSGKRSKEAGELLLENGFHHVINVADGFEGELDDNHQRSTIAGWRYAKLPWEQC